MYIRTKDGVYEELDTTEQGVWTIYGDFIKNNEILNQSETIEELCDRFVAKTCDITKYRVEQRLEYAKIYCGVETIYGAIWTEWGLKYVAKMNENGELELI